MSLNMLIIGGLFGVGFGYFIQRAGFCVAHGLGEIYMGKAKRFLRLILVIISITALGFLISGYVSSDLGLKTIGQLRGYGFYNLVSGMLFGAGILLNGGCILGTLRQIGEGNMTFFVVLVSFIPGMALVVYVLNPLLEHGYNINNILIPQLLGVPAVYVTLSLVAGLVVWFIALSKKG